MDYEPEERCPQCDESLGGSNDKCPECGTEVAWCERGSHFVLRSRFKAAVDMCNDCMDRLSGRDD